MVENHPIEGLMNIATNNLRQLVDINTIIGNPIQPVPGTTIVPISKVGFGFASGGSEFNTKANNNNEVRDDMDKNNSGSKKYPFGGGSGATVSIKPIGFLVLQNDTIKILNIEHDGNIDKLFDYAPEVINKANSIIDKIVNKGEKS